MGAWGTGIFSDDLAADIRGEYNALLSVGKNNEEAEGLLINYYSEILGKGYDDESVFWFALALCEWKKGRLSAKTRAKALSLIEGGNDLERWNTEGNYDNYIKRQKVMEELKKNLISPQPEIKKVRKATVHHCPWQVGSLLAYRIVTDHRVVEHPLFNKYALLRVIKIKRHPVSRIVPSALYNESMLVGVYGWAGDEIPNPNIVKDLEFIPICEEEYIHVSKVQTCADLYWLPVLGNKGDITYLSCDLSFQESIPSFFKTRTTEYSMYNFFPFDVTLTQILLPYYLKKN